MHFFFSSVCLSLMLRGFFCSKTCLNLAISRIKLLQNKRDMQLKHMRKEIAQFLQAGQEAIARIRVPLHIYDHWMLIYCKCFSVWLFRLIWLGGACYKGTEHVGSIWHIRAVLWICSCTCSNNWKPEVKPLITRIFFIQYKVLKYFALLVN